MLASPSNLNGAARDHRKDSPSSGSAPSLVDTKHYHHLQTHISPSSASMSSPRQGLPMPLVAGDLPDCRRRHWEVGEAGTAL